MRKNDAWVPLLLSLRYPPSMPVLAVGDTTIPYEIRRSRRAKRMRITVRPGEVRVIAPLFVRRSRIAALVESKRRWIFEKTHALRERQIAARPDRFVDGARVLFRGRSLRLHVETTNVPRATLRFANAFHVQAPHRLDDQQQEQSVRAVVVAWLTRRALDDAYAWARTYGQQLDLHPSRIRIGSRKTLWGSCSARGVISLNWRLIATPKPVFEYVVVHELCHLAESNSIKPLSGLRLRETNPLF
jgi:predicted metal-dependent hydrolase